MHRFVRTEYKKLAPKKWIYDEYVRTKEATFYSLFYGIEVLSKLDPIEVSDELGCGSILTCYEPAGQFCHRRLVSQWFNKHGIKCIELDPNWLMNCKFDKFVESGCQGDLDHI